MALVNAETTIMELVAEQEQEEKRATALGVAEPVKTEVAVVAPTLIAPMDFLRAHGLGNIRLDFTSFPTITLNNNTFSTDDHKAFGTEFEFRYMDERQTFLFKADMGREAEPKLVYSDDGLFDNRADDAGNIKPMADWIAEWKADPKVVGTERKAYIMVIGKMIGGVHDDEIVQLQISPASQGKLAGFQYGLGMDNILMSQIITKVGIGNTVGSGIKEFQPWLFKKLK